MKNASPTTSFLPASEELHSFRDNWPWFMALGVGMVALGTFAIGWGCLATITDVSVLIFGFFLLVCGIAEIVHSFWMGRWSGLLLHLLIGVLYTLAGLMIIDQPENAAVKLTLLIAVFLMFSGVFRFVFAISERFTGWGWVLLNGVVTFVLGLLIYKGLPDTGLWVIGLFIGIDLIMNGWTWIALALGMRRLKAAA